MVRLFLSNIVIMVKNKPIGIEIVKAAWTASPNHGTQLDRREKLVKLRPKILMRDNNTCQACGLKTDHWQEMHHINGQHRDDRESNLETRCPLCHQLAHLPQASACGGGKIIWLPEWSQIELNKMCVALFVALRSTQHRWHGMAKSLYSMLETRAVIMHDVMGSSDPGMFSKIVIGLPEQHQQKALNSVRLLPHPARFQHVIDDWSARLFPPHDQWEQLVPEDLPLIEIMQKIQKK